MSMNNESSKRTRQPSEEELHEFQDNDHISSRHKAITTYQSIAQRPPLDDGSLFFQNDDITLEFSVSSVFADIYNNESLAGEIAYLAGQYKVHFDPTHESNAVSIPGNCPFALLRVISLATPPDHPLHYLALYLDSTQARDHKAADIANLQAEIGRIANSIGREYRNVGTGVNKHWCPDRLDEGSRHYRLITDFDLFLTAGIDTVSTEQFPSLNPQSHSSPRSAPPRSQRTTPSPTYNVSSPRARQQPPPTYLSPPSTQAVERFQQPQDQAVLFTQLSHNVMGMVNERLSFHFDLRDREEKERLAAAKILQDAALDEMRSDTQALVTSHRSQIDSAHQALTDQLASTRALIRETRRESDDRAEMLHNRSQREHQDSTNNTHAMLAQLSRMISELQATSGAASTPL